MAGISELFKTVKGRTILNYAYSIGAAVVIAGALFKIMHWPGANIMLILGMGTEVLIFFISAFEPQYVDKHYEWERVYPELALSGEPKKGEKSLTQQLDQALANAKIGPELINSLGGSLKSLAETTEKLTDLTDATVAAKSFAESAKTASGTISSFAQAAASATGSVGKIAEGAEYTKIYHEQVQNMVKNLSQLNAIYELELQDSNNHLKAMNKFFGNLNAAAEALSGTATDALKYKEELVKLNKNLASLNAVYGNMLAAMKAQ
ncbi:MAG: gliding motility protein GldL [Chitinophagales bacterium]|nr:gliding motility protein GldL [Chitinophagales bacterium]MDW8274220.1 gliding motility protein GldL [Chitinophagales bacterium]